MKKEPLPESVGTEKRIKEAALHIFLKDGLHGARTADIAVLAQTTPSLIFYYFRNKEKLYQVVMIEALGQFLQNLIPIVNDASTSFERKIELVVDRYVYLVSKGPHIPLFVLNEMQKNHSGVNTYSRKMRNALNRSVMAEQLQFAIKQGCYKPVSFSDVIMNILGLTVFPVVAAPVVQTMGGLSQEMYDQLLRERHKHIACWVLQLLK